MEVFRDEVPKLREAWARAGRESHELQIQGDLDAIRDERGRPDLEESLKALPEWIEAGATTVNVVMSLFGGYRRAPAFFESVQRAWSELGPMASREDPTP
jgi:hypothetical protein